MHRHYRGLICGMVVALCLAACGSAAQPTPLPTLSAAERQAQIAQMTQVAVKLTATTESRQATATAAAVPTVAPTPTATTIRPTPTPGKPGSGAPLNVAANLKDFKLHAYQGDASLGSGDVQFSNVFAYRLPVIVNVWAPLCAPCRQEMPAFQRVSNDYAGRAFFMGLDLGTYMGLGNQTQAAQFLKDVGINYPNAYPLENPARSYNILSLPTTLYFSPDGKLLHQDVGALDEDGLRENVETLVHLTSAIPTVQGASWLTPRSGNIAPTQDRACLPLVATRWRWVSPS